MPFPSHQALTLMPLLRQAAIRSLQTATFSCRFSVCKLFSITVSPVSDSIFQSPRLHDTIRYYGDIFSHLIHSSNPPPGLTVTLQGSCHGQQQECPSHSCSWEMQYSSKPGYMHSPIEQGNICPSASGAPYSFCGTAVLHAER